jgi:TonB family protein
MGAAADCGQPMEFETRFVPAAALAASLLLHGAILLTGWFGTGPGRGPGTPVRPRLRARRAEFALMIPSPSEVSRAEKKAHEAVRRPVARPREIERESITGAPPAETRPPEAELARAEHEAEPPPRSSVSVVKVERSSELSRRPSEGGVRSAHLLEGAGVPEYPRVCKREGIEGDGEYGLAVDETGSVTDVRVIRSAGHPELDKAAKLFFIYRAKCEPATLDGLPIPFSTRMRVSFRIEAR